MPMQSCDIAQLIREASLADGQQTARGKAGKAKHDNAYYHALLSSAALA